MRRYYTWRTLRWVNKVRREFKLADLTSLRPGLSGSSTHCVLAECFKDRLQVVVVGRATISFMINGQHYVRALPGYVEAFIQLFDENEFPELDYEGGYEEMKLRDLSLQDRIGAENAKVLYLKEQERVLEGKKGHDPVADLEELYALPAVQKGETEVAA